MRLPTLASTVERRLLINYRVDPAAAARLLPAPLRPQLVNGFAVAGVCLIRLGNVRPAWAPKPLGLRSENAAHRIAVEWDGPDGVDHGVYIPRRDTSSPLNAWAGGRIFPGEHHTADFQIRENADELHVAYTTRDRTTHVEIDAELDDELHDSRLFSTLEQASTFFRTGATGYSATTAGDHLDGMRLHTERWQVSPCRVRHTTSTFFEDPANFPPGSATFDCALLMRDLPAHWHSLPPLSAMAP